jgi:ATP-dependent DNA helicase RecG
MALTDAELESLLADLESDRVERKASLRGDAAGSIREAICAMANDLPGHKRPGVILVGAHDDGRPSDLSVDDALLRELADMRSDGNIVPPPTLTVEKRHLRGADIAVISVWPADSPPVRYRGRICIRVGPRRGVASAQDERVLNEKRRFRDRPFDVQPLPSASLEDLHRRRFDDEYVVHAFAPEVIDANDRTFEERLAATKMVVSADEPIPTVLGILVLGHRPRAYLPGAYLQFLRIAGRTLGDPIADALEIDGAVADVLRRIDEKMSSHNRTAVDLTSDVVERRVSLLPPVALQQVVRNAVMHRTYEASYAPVRVTWYDDRVEIVSPGGPFGSVTPENFGYPGFTDYRNPNLAEALKVMGFVQRFGVGISTAQRELSRNGNPPAEFHVTSANVGVTLRMRG